MLGYHPDVILAGRRINDGMGKFIADETVKLMIREGGHIKGAKVNVLGITFKENVGDLRNSKVIDLVRELESFGIEVIVHDPVASPAEAKRKYGVNLVEWGQLPKADALVVAVAHEQFLSMPQAELLAKVADDGVFIDVKSRYDDGALQAAGLSVWRL